MSREYNVIVIGAGHAGIEAAFAAQRGGADTALITLKREKIGEMSCNPAIGGLAKGHIVCEVDAMGGFIGLAADKTGIQFRMLNRSKGPAVWGPRAQTDKLKYSRFAQQFLQDLDNLDIIEAEAAEILTENNKVIGVRLADDSELHSRAVIVTSGTFLNGLIHIGERQFPAGRINEPPARLLSDSLSQLGIKIGRLKTGTCPRLSADSIDYDKCELQPGDENPIPFSMLTDKIDIEQTPCHITYTNPQTHKIISDNLDRAPLYTGQISSTGPRYCPSIEVKIVRFADKNRHQIYLEPESLEYDWIYCNGLATSIPEDLQEAMVHSIAGLEKAKIVQYGYAIEYDFIFPEQLTADLQSKRIRGLFFAGQINGTSGYEEAAGQGLLAGINALQYIKDKEPIILRRDQAYIGVMIDDLVTKGVNEPYRMFTSRAEYRLLLRADTAERRLTPLAHQLGILDAQRWSIHLERERQREKFRQLLKENRVEGLSAYDWLRRPENSLDELKTRLPANIFEEIDYRIQYQIVADIKYEGYQKRELKSAEKLRQLERVKLPRDIDYSSIAGLRKEAQEKLTAVKPATIGQASRISGITPADILVLTISLNKS